MCGNNIVLKKETDKLKDLINQYKFEADRLACHAAALRKELDGQEDMDIINRLKKRIRLLETERYEILRDISDMQNGQKFSQNGLI